MWDIFCAFLTTKDKSASEQVINFWNASTNELRDCCVGQSNSNVDLVFMPRIILFSQHYLSSRNSATVSNKPASNPIIHCYLTPLMILLVFESPI